MYCSLYICGKQTANRGDGIHLLAGVQTKRRWMPKYRYFRALAAAWTPKGEYENRSQDESVQRLLLRTDSCVQGVLFAYLALCLLASWPANWLLLLLDRYFDSPHDPILLCRHSRRRSIRSSRLFASPRSQRMARSGCFEALGGTGFTNYAMLC
ncbi:hypothetical protein GGR54DRAFT_204973 [Hypoxylon sp. NC1633]|nr:hypothetical protein GGR54DRAFT_204973 [Hypoxylon sp. NC1633]